MLPHPRPSSQAHVVCGLALVAVTLGTLVVRPLPAQDARNGPPAASSAPAASPAAGTVGRAVRAIVAPVIDGKEDDAVWRIAPPMVDFRQFDPGENLAPAFRTEARVAYDDRNLYVLVRAFDPHPDSISSLLSRRDVRTASDQLKIIIDAYKDRRSGVEMAVNPAGVKRLLVGVANQTMIDRMALVLQARGVERAILIHADDGLDELSLGSTCTLVEVTPTTVVTTRFNPAEQLGVHYNVSELRGGDVGANERAVREYLGGKRGAIFDTVTANAGLALVVAGRTDSFEAGVLLASAAVLDGSAQRALEQLVLISNGDS